VPELVSSLPVVLKALRRGKVTPKGALLHPHKAPKEVKRIFQHVHDQEERFELNLYVVGADEEQPGQGEQSADAAGSQLPEERSPNQ
jgi:succinate dehydrogenase / fumarate reductase iron-sulfur subunit